MNNINQIGSVISKLRKTKGVTQEDVAKFVGISAQAVSKWENGSVPDTELLPKIADYFDISIDTLFGREYASGDAATGIYKHIPKFTLTTVLPGWALPTECSIFCLFRRLRIKNWLCLTGSTTSVPNTAFIALLIFTREMIDRPNRFAYNSGFRTKPFL